MVMDPRLRGIFESMNGFKLNGGGSASVSDHQNLINLFTLNKSSSPTQSNFMNYNHVQTPDPNNVSGNVSSSSCSSHVDDASEDCDFSDVVLKYISEMLMEEDIDGKNCMFQDSSALQAAEKPFYEIIGEKYPPSPNFPPTYLNQGPQNQVDYFTGSYSDYNYSSSSNGAYNFSGSNGADHNGIYNYSGSNGAGYAGDRNGAYNYSSTNGAGYAGARNGANNYNGSNGAGYAVDTNWNGELSEYMQSQTHNSNLDYSHQITPQSSLSSTHSSNSAPDGLVDSPVSKIQVPDIFCENMPIWHFQRGVEEANKFLPSGSDLIVSTESNGSFFQEPKKEVSEVVIKVEKKDERELSPNGSRGKKNLHREEVDLEEGRSNKQSAVFSEQLVVRSPMFDSVLLCSGEKGESAVFDLREALQSETNKNVQQNGGSSKGTNGGKSRGKKNSAKKDMVDLRTLLIHCAQAVAADDRRSANELLKQIRQHSSAYGDGSQRLAHCFADGLEARLAGTGSQIHGTLLTKRTSTADILKAYQLYLAACPFKKVSNFFSNHSIMTLAENASSIHIVDFGILYGFQWPCLLQRLSARPGGPPKLRITGVDFPQPGFRPAERVEETGRRLADYAKSFNVPFEYTAIAQKWETIQLEDLKINRDEVLVVNCLYRFRNLLDETVVLDSPRTAVLQLVKKMNPDIFIHGIVNGSFSAPFFVTRFREALFHYSALFDMLETNVPRDHPERLLLERDLFGREALNVIACEGSERVERPETYKQWQVRNMRAGFKQLPLNQEIIKKARERKKMFYHKDFVIDEDSQWLLQGWKGRIIYALSTWKPARSS